MALLEKPVYTREHPWFQLPEHQTVVAFLLHLNGEAKFVLSLLQWKYVLRPCCRKTEHTEKSSVKLSACDEASSMCTQWIFQKPCRLHPEEYLLTSIWKLGGDQFSLQGKSNGYGCHLEKWWERKCLHFPYILIETFMNGPSGWPWWSCSWLDLWSSLVLIIPAICYFSQWGLFCNNSIHLLRGQCFFFLGDFLAKLL